jgi:hypothetical protein
MILRLRSVIVIRVFAPCGAHPIAGVDAQSIGGNRIRKELCPVPDYLQLAGSECTKYGR